MNRIVPFSVLAVLLLTLVPTAQAAWTTSVSVPASFRPERAVTFTYTASSSSAADLPLAWRVTLYTCQDTDADTWCEVADANRVDHGDRTINLVGGQASTVSWTVNLAQPEGSYWYHFHTVCLNNPCTGSFQPGGAHNRTGAFQLAYTNTWARQIITTTPTSQGSSQAVTYRMTSTSVNDRDLAGSAELASIPPSGVVVLYPAKSYSAPAGSTQDVQWTGVTFPQIGTHLLQVSDTNAATSTFSVTVRGVHLHVTQPRPVYAEGARFSLYFTLEGHGATPDPGGIQSADIALTITNGSFPVLSTTIRTDASGRAYANVTAPADAQRLNWRAITSGTWNGVTYTLQPEGYVDFAPLVLSSNHTALEQNVTAIRENLSDVQLKGVHLNELGSRNAWMMTLRATGAVVLVVLLVLLVLTIAWRI